MADYRPETCAYCQAATWCEIRANGKPQCRACKVERFFARVLYPPLGYRLLAWQRKVLRDIYGTVSPEDGRRRYRSAYISVGKKNGKALSLETPIPTPFAWKSMGEIGVGDRVIDECGIPCNVVAVSPVYLDHHCFRVSFSNGEQIVADAGHQWITWDQRTRKAYDFHCGSDSSYPSNWTSWSSANAASKKYDDGAREAMRAMRAKGMSSAAIGLKIGRTASAVQQQWNRSDSDTPVRVQPISTEQLAGTVFFGKEHNHSIPTTALLCCDHADLPLDPYVLGYLLGDGDPAGTGRVACDPQDRSWLMGEFRSAGFEVAEHAGSVHFGVQGIRDQWKRLGLHNGKHVPSAYLRASLSQRLACLQGLIDSDGYVDNHGSYRFTNTNPALIDGFCELAASLGCIARRSEREGSNRAGVTNADSQEVIVSTSQVLSRLPRKATAARQQWNREQESHYVVSVETIPSVPVKCIQVDSPSHMYLCGRTMLPTHNSFLIGGLPLYHLLLENERNPEAYGAAAAKDQAGLVFKAAAQLVAANPELQSRLRVLPSTKRIVRRDGGGFYAVLSADGDLQDGIEPSLAIRDEVHRWKTLRAETLRDVLVKGQISRVEPLDIGITTAGAEYESQLWWREYQQAKKVLDGSQHSDTFYAAIWEADVKRIESDPEYWKSREARIAANPSHEDLGGFLKDSAIAGELDKALAEPSERSKYLRYHLNVPLKAQEDPIIDMAKWQACGGGVDLRVWPEYDFNLLIREWNLAGKPCWAGVDASWTTDLTSVVFVFPPFDGEQVWTLLPFFWVPQEKVPQLDRVCRVPYSTWIRQSFIDATPGNSIDQRAVMERIRWGREKFELREMPFDRFNFRSEAMNLADEGIAAVEIQQSFLHLSHPTKFLLSAYVDQKIRHGNNPVLSWMASCLQLQYDSRDNCMPSKPERGKSAKRIDGISATVTALARATVFEDNTIVYTGVRSV